MSLFQRPAGFGDRVFALRPRRIRARVSAVVLHRQLSGSSARETRTLPQVTSATSRKAPSSARRVSTESSAARHRPAASWLLDVTNVSITPYTYNEDFTRDDAVLSRDNLKIAFRVHTVWRVDDTQNPAVHGAVQHDVIGWRSGKGSRCHREDRVRTFRARTAQDLRARRSAAAQRNGGQGRAHPDRRRRARAHSRDIPPAVRS